MRILCSGMLIRHPVGGHTWHDLQYLVGLQQLGHEVHYVEHYGWRDACYDLGRDAMTPDPSYGIAYVRRVLALHGLERRWCYLAEDGTARGMSRERLLEVCRASDLYIALSSLNWIPELEECRRRALVDTDPVFTQIGAHGSGELSNYHALFTYGENVHRPGCDMPTGGLRWLPTRQPIVLDLWPASPANPLAPFTTVTNWSPVPDRWHEGRLYRNKDGQFEPFFTLPRETGEEMAIAVGGVGDAHAAVARFGAGGWRLEDARAVSRDPASYRRFIQASRAEFSVAKHAYVVTRCGWFSDRSAAYLASGRPVVLQDTGFSEWLPVGEAVLAFSTPDGATAALSEVNAGYASRCRAARALAAEYFDARVVLPDLVERAVGVPEGAGTGRC